jgi:glutaconyl-CoA/methylmalonyl-CoA decarboxylase subunit gamma
MESDGAKGGAEPLARETVSDLLPFLTLWCAGRRIWRKQDDAVKLEYTFHGGKEERNLQIEVKSLPSSREVSGCLEIHRQSAWSEANWAEVAPRVYSILVDGRSFDVRIENNSEGSARRGFYTVHVGTRVYQMELRDPRRVRRSGAAGSQDGPLDISAPMPGRIVKVLVAAGQEVKSGDSLIVIEAMKMQNEIRAPRNGRVEVIRVTEGEGVENGALLLRLV